MRWKASYKNIQLICKCNMEVVFVCLCVCNILAE